MRSNCTSRPTRDISYTRMMNFYRVEAPTLIGRSIDESVGNRIGQLPGHSKIAYLDLSFEVEGDIGGLDVWSVSEKGRKRVSRSL